MILGKRSSRWMELEFQAREAWKLQRQLDLQRTIFGDARARAGGSRPCSSIRHLPCHVEA